MQDIKDPKWVNEETLAMLNRGYLLRGETVMDAIDRICLSATKQLKGTIYESKAFGMFKRNIVNGWVSFSSPVWSNMGTSRGLPISCFNVHIPDNMYLIGHKHLEVVMQTKYGGGTSSYWGEVRSRGTEITDNGKAGGPVPFMKMFDTAISAVSQGSCYVEGTKVLTNNGFKDFRDVVKGVDKLAMPDSKNNITFTSDYELTVNNHTGKVIGFRGIKNSSLVDIKVTPNHRMVINKLKKNKSGKNWSETTEIVKAEDLNLHRDNRMFMSGNSTFNGYGLTDEERFMIAYQADGQKDDGVSVKFRFKKKRKIERLTTLLDNMGLEYSVKPQSTDTDIINVFVYGVKHLKKRDLSWVGDISVKSKVWCEEFLDEVSHWDGSLSRNNDEGKFSFSSIYRINVEIIQSIAVLCGKRTRIKEYTERKGNRVDLYSIYVSNISNVGGDSIEKYEEDYNGKVYCAIVPMGRLVVSYNDRTLICGNTRRGAHAVYLDIDHADVEEFLNIREIGNDIQNLFFGVNVPDYWMADMIAGDVNKRKLWARVHESRKTKGMPYIFYNDTANKNKPQIYKDRKASINSSNLCSEIMLPSTAEESFVCCLSSMNIGLYDEWKDTDAVFWAMLFLDCVLTEFIDKTENLKAMETTRNFAIRHRAVGLGVLGYHAYLQSKMVAFDSFEASRINLKIFKQLKEQSYAASEEIGWQLGYAPIFLEGETTDVPRRNTTTMAVAPTTSSSSILSVALTNEDGTVDVFNNSAGIEPYSSNYYKVGLAKGNFMRKNGFLTKLLKEIDKDNEDVWRSIMLHHGSVQHLDFLTDEQKSVFKTFKEISPFDIVASAAQRQPYIDQTQSLNLLIPTEMPVKDVNRVYIEAWEKGVKTLYYQRSSSVSKEMMTGFVTCNSCES